MKTLTPSYLNPDYVVLRNENEFKFFDQMDGKWNPLDLSTFKSFRDSWIEITAAEFYMKIL